MREDDAFEQYHKALRLPPEEVAFARTFPDLVREILADSTEITISHSFLQGSLDRGTMVPPLKDADMVATLNRDRHRALLDDPDGPDKAMDLFERVLEEPLRARFPSMEFTDRTAHAVQFDLGPQLPSFDLVPAFEESEPPGEYGNVYIADSEDQAWEWSNPRQLSHQVAKCNQACHGRLIHVCRMVKNPLKHDPVLKDFPGRWWRHWPATACPGSSATPKAWQRCLRKGHPGSGTARSSTQPVWTTWLSGSTRKG